MLNKRPVAMIAMWALAALVFTGCYRTPEQRAEYMVKRIASNLDLSDAQKALLEKIQDEFLAKRPEMDKQREESVKEANQIMRSAEIDKARLNALVEKSQNGANHMILFVSAKFTQIHDMLTPEQREKFAKHVEEYMLHGNH